MTVVKWLAVVLTGLMLSPSLVYADEEVERIFARARSINPGLKDYSVSVDADLRATVGPLTYQPKVKGKYFFKQVSQHRLDIVEGPRQLKKYPMIFGLNLPKLEDYDSSLLEDSLHKGSPVFHCRLIAKSPDQMVTQVDLLIDKEYYTVPHTVTQFRDQGEFTVDVDYTLVDSYRVFECMRASGEFPSAGTSASGEVHYSHYQFNQNLPQKLFSRNGGTARQLFYWLGLAGKSPGWLAQVTI